MTRGAVSAILVASLVLGAQTAAAGEKVFDGSPSVVNFGRVPIGTSSPLQLVTVTNVSSTSQLITGIRVIGDGGFGFSSPTGGNPSATTCLAATGNVTLAPGDSCVIEVGFNPVVRGPARARLEITGTFDNTGWVTVATLRGFGTTT